MYHTEHNGPDAHPITDGDIFRLRRRASTTHMQSLVELLISGAAIGELASLRWDDIDADGRAIALHGRKKCTRTIPLTLGLVSLLVDHLTWQDASNRLLGTTPSEYVFRKIDGQPMPVTDLAMDFIAHARRTLGRTISPHAVRAWMARRNSR